MATSSPFVHTQAIPLIMVLYSDDSTQVRYSDGSCLYLTPCGSSFVYQPGNNDENFYFHNQLPSLRYQRTEFVTSIHRESVIQALDFRNRFAQRPYLSSPLLPSQSIESRYSDISFTHWPSFAASASVDSDCTVTVKSKNEHAVLILSSHGRDFTVCYLSKLSKKTIKSRNRSDCDKNNSRKEKIVGVNNNQGQQNNFETHSSDQQTHCDKYGDGSFQQSHVSAFSQYDKSVHFSANSQSNIASESDSYIVNDTLNMKSVVPVSHLDDGNVPNSKFEQGNIPGVKTRLKDNDQKILMNSHSTSQFHQLKLTNPNDIPSYDDRPKMKEVPANKIYERESHDKRFRYTWISQHCSVLDCPIEWQHALQLAAELQRQQESKSVDGDNVLSIHPTSGDDFSIASPLPQPLPLTCNGQFLHKPLTTGLIEQTGRLKVLLSEGVVYRFHSCVPTSVDIFPGDGSVIYSNPPSNRHYTYISATPPHELRSYSLSCLPPDHPGQSYSLAKLISTAAKYLEHEFGEDLSTQPTTICWQYSPEIPNPSTTQLIEECCIPNVARYRAFNNGLITVLFSDRVLLKTSTHLLIKEEKAKDCTNLQIFWNNTCNLMLTTGEYVTVNVNNPGNYKRYVSMAKEWIEWVTSPSSTSHQHFTTGWQDQQNHRAVDKELQKIKTFDYILDNSIPGALLADSCPSYLPKYDTDKSKHDNQSSNNSTFENYAISVNVVDSVESALNNTSKLIYEIDSLLESSYDS